MTQQLPLASLQLYTVREPAAEDMEAVLRQVARAGYQGVELAGTGNLTPQTIAPILQELERKVVGSHMGFSALRDNLDAIVAENQLLGNQYVVCPSIPNEMRSTEGYKSFAAQLNEMGSKLKAAGLHLCYHNHAFEFEKYDGEYGLDILYANSDPELVQAELDTYWVQKGGADPVEYLKKYAGRAPLVHLKDMGKDAEQSFAEVGEGILDWPNIFAACDAGNVTAYIVEQDICPGNPMDSARLSLENLKKMGRVVGA